MLPMKGLFNIILFFVLATTCLHGQIIPNVLGTLPNTVSETSGLLFYNNKIITHNDSGNLPQLYEIDTLSLAITRTVNISNALNVDWEDIAQDDTYIYIGDIGNNNGTRKDLTVYRVLKEEYNTLDTVTADKIIYAYDDQTSFVDSGNSDWDAEAMFVLDNQLIILTKQWDSGGTVSYFLPILPGNYSATKLDSYFIDGLVTGASYNPDSGKLLIIGYSSLLTPFLYQLKGLTSTSIFGGEVTNLNVTMGNAQVEGITYVSENRYFFSSELFKREVLLIEYNTSLYTFSLNEEEIPEPEEEKKDLLLYSKVADNQLFYELPEDFVVLGRAIYDVTGKRFSYALGQELESDFIDTSGLQSAMYYLTIYGRNGILSKPFIKN